MLGVLCSDQRKNGQIDDASSSQLGGGGEKKKLGEILQSDIIKGTCTAKCCKIVSLVLWEKGTVKQGSNLTMRRRTLVGLQFVASVVSCAYKGTILLYLSYAGITRLFIYCLFNDTVSRIVGWLLNWKLCGRKRSWPNLRYCPGMFPKGLRKTTRNLSAGVRELSSGPQEYEVVVLTVLPRPSICNRNVLSVSFV
jgi:hypothetical protein